jgi:hypothetical protein
MLRGDGKPPNLDDHPPWRGRGDGRPVRLCSSLRAFGAEFSSGRGMEGWQCATATATASALQRVFKEIIYDRGCLAGARGGCLAGPRR